MARHRDQGDPALRIEPLGQGTIAFLRRPGREINQGAAQLNLWQDFLHVTLRADARAQRFMAIDDRLHRTLQLFAMERAAEFKRDPQHVGQRAGLAHLGQRPQLPLRRGKRNRERRPAGCGGPRELLPEAAVAHRFNAVSDACDNDSQVGVGVRRREEAVESLPHVHSPVDEMVVEQIHLQRLMT